jgi:hypothetical protein
MFFGIRQGILAMSVWVRTAVLLLLGIGALLHRPQRFDIPTTAPGLSASKQGHLISNMLDEPVPPLRDFMDSLAYAGGDAVAGIYVPGTLAMPVVQQPVGAPSFISNQANVVTQFELASHYGNAGLLAHNYLAGAKILQLEIGQLIYLIFDDGSTQVYIVSELLHYQALSPKSFTSDFRSLDDSSGQLSAQDLFYQIYAERKGVILQTCISSQGVLDWGRLFVIAVPSDIWRLRMRVSVNELGTR